MLVLFVFATQVILYILNEKLGGKIPYSLIWLLIILTFIFVLPQFNTYPIIESSDEGECGMPAMAFGMISFLKYYIFAPIIATLFHLFWMLRIWRKKSPEDLNQP